MIFLIAVCTPIHLVPYDICGLVQVLRGGIDEFGEHVGGSCRFHIS